MDKLISIGYTQKANGINGDIKVTINEQYIEDFLHSSVVFLKIQGKDVPFFIEKIHTTNSLLVKFEDINNRDAATPFTGKEILLREKDLIPDEERELEVEEFLQFKKYEGYALIDKSAGIIGEILEVVEFPQQEMGVVDYQNREIYVPLNDNLIIEIDKGKKEILIDLPEGLLDL